MKQSCMCSTTTTTTYIQGLVRRWMCATLASLLTAFNRECLRHGSTGAHLQTDMVFTAETPAFDGGPRSARANLRDLRARKDAPLSLCSQSVGAGTCFTYGVITSSSHGVMVIVRHSTPNPNLSLVWVSQWIRRLQSCAVPHTLRMPTDRMTLFRDGDFVDDIWTLWKLVLRLLV